MNKNIANFLSPNILPDYKVYLKKKGVVNDILIDDESVVKNGIAALKTEGKKSISEIYKLGEYIYEAEYNELDYAYALEYFQKIKPKVYGALGMKPFGCSSLRVGNFYGRNFDFYYNNDCSFVIKTPKNGKLNATIGIGSYFGKLTKNVVESGKYTDDYRLLPFLIVDGINEHGVFVNTNVVTVEGRKTTGTVPTEEKKGDFCMMMLPRYILDNHKTAKEAIEDIEKHYSVFLYDIEAISGSELHFMIGDENETYIMEFVNNKLVYEKLGEKHPEVMTNFYTIGTTLVDGKIDESPENKSGVALLGCGIERYNTLIDTIPDINSEVMMYKAMKYIWYTKSYVPSEKMYTEFVGLPDKLEEGKILTVETPREHYEPTLELAKSMYEKRNRNQGIKGIWHTTHCSIYDIKKRKLHLYVQENEFDSEGFIIELSKKNILN